MNFINRKQNISQKQQCIYGNWVMLQTKTGLLKLSRIEDQLLWFLSCVFERCTYLYIYNWLDIGNKIQKLLKAYTKSYKKGKGDLLSCPIYHMHTGLLPWQPDVIISVCTRQCCFQYTWHNNRHLTATAGNSKQKICSIWRYQLFF